MKNKLLVIKENFEDEGSMSDDIEDEVFVRDGKKLLIKQEKPRADERPLMATRKKSKQKQSSPEVFSRQPCNIYNCLLPVYFGIATVISIAFLMLLYVFLVEKLPLLISKFTFWPNDENNQDNLTVPCLNLKLNPIWTQGIEKIISDAQIEMVDITQDNVEDVILGFGTELDMLSDNERICNQYFGKTPCFGGVTAVDGKNGSVIWYQWLPRTILSVHCKIDITNDTIPDCIVTGKGGILAALNGINGAIIWKFPKSVQEYELYSIAIIRDIDGDGCQDILASHFKKNDRTQESYLIFITSKNGTQTKKLPVPNNEIILNAPQLLIDVSGSEQILYVTGDLTNSGGLYMTSFNGFAENRTKTKTLFHSETGIIAAPILVDINLDFTEDIVFLASNSVYILDGLQHNILWNVSLYQFNIPDTYQILEISSVTPAYFNDDWIPDFLVMFNVGESYPEYYYTVILVLDGQTGKMLLNKPIIRSSTTDTVGAISLSLSGKGNDAFIFWTASCQNYANAKNKYEFLPYEERQFWTDLCALRFNSSSQIELYGLSQHVEPPGSLLYSAKSYTNSFTDNNINYDQGNTEIKEQPIDPSYYKTKTSFRKLYPPLIQLQRALPIELENMNEPYVNKKKNVWKPGIPVEQKNDDLVKYKTNEGYISNQLNDYEIPDTDNNNVNYANNRIYSATRKVKRNIYGHNSMNNFNDMLPKVAAAGAITKSFDNKNLDLILVHYEVKVDPEVRIITNKNDDCLRRKLSISSSSDTKYYDSGTLDDCYENNNDYVSRESIKQNKLVNYKFGNLFITRNRISCSCDVVRKENKEICSTILPYEQQSYPTFLGKLESSTFGRRKNVI